MAIVASLPGQVQSPLVIIECTNVIDREAYKASAYVEGLMSRGAIEPQADTNLDHIYERYGPDAPHPQESESSTPLLRREAVSKIVSLYELPSTAEADLYRALDQTATRLKKTS